jgi:hypothetical protein
MKAFVLDQRAGRGACGGGTRPMACLRNAFAFVIPFAFAIYLSPKSCSIPAQR